MSEHMTLPEIITLESGTLELKSEGYIFGVMSGYSQVTLEEAKLREEAFVKLCQGVPRPFVFETRSILIDYTNEAREFMAHSKVMSEIRKAEAFIVDNIGVQMFIKDYLRKNPEKCPAQVFSEKEEALEWIKQFL